MGGRQVRTTSSAGNHETLHDGPSWFNGWAGTNYDGTGGGFQAGGHIGSTGNMGDPSGLHGRVDVGSANGYFGLGDNGNIGFGASGRGAHFEGGWGKPGDGMYGSADLDAFAGDAYGYVNPDSGAGLGATAAWLQGSVTAGNIGSGNHDKEGRFGLAAGVGAAGRLHWGDADGDGLREYGFGADIGPISFDVKSEDPARDFLLNTATFGLGGMALDAFGYEGNLTQDIGSGLSSAGSWIADTASSAGSAIASGASAAWSALTSW